MKTAWLSAVRGVIESRYLERLSLPDISREVGVHPAHLARAFHQCYGETIGSMIRKLRLEHAKTELQRGQKSLVEIAMDAGFYDQSHFHHAFKRYTGKTPAEFSKILPGKVRSACVK